MHRVIVLSAFAALFAYGMQADVQAKQESTTTTVAAKPKRITTADEAMAAATAAGWTNVTGLTQKGKGGHGAWHGMGVPPGGASQVPLVVTPTGKVHQGDANDTD